MPMWLGWLLIFSGVVLFIGAVAFASASKGSDYDDSLEKYFDEQEREP